MDKEQYETEMADFQDKVEKMGEKERAQLFHVKKLFNNMKQSHPLLYEASGELLKTSMQENIHQSQGIVIAMISMLHEENEVLKQQVSNLASLIGEKI